MEHVHSAWIALEKGDRAAIALTLADQTASVRAVQRYSVEFGEVVQWLEPGVADRGTVDWHATPWRGADHLVAAYLLDAAELLPDSDATVVMGVASLEAASNYRYLSQLQLIAGDLGAHERPILTDLRPGPLARIDGLRIESVRYLDEAAGVERVERNLDLDDSGRMLRGDRAFTGVTVLRGEIVLNLYEDEQLFLRNVSPSDVPGQLRQVGPALWRLA
jgi:hypothetical protein